MTKEADYWFKPRSYGYGAALWFGGIAVITVPFIWLCRVKTDGEWRWSWGGK